MPAFGQHLDSDSSAKSSSSSQGASEHQDSGGADSLEDFDAAQDTATGPQEVIRVNDTACAVCDDGGMPFGLLLGLAHHTLSSQASIGLKANMLG